MLGGHAYTVTGNRITKTNVSTGTTADLAGANISGCADAYTGAAAIFANPRIIGNDGSLIYVNEIDCGIRSVNPVTGATRMLSYVSGGTSAITGRYIYTNTNQGELWRYDIQSGLTKKIFGTYDKIAVGTIAADDQYVWNFSNDNTLRRYDPNTTITAGYKTFAVPYGAMDAAISVGNYIYVRSYNNTVMRVNKTDGSTQIIAGDSAHGNDSRKDDLLTGITGIATDGTSSTPATSTDSPSSRPSPAFMRLRRRVRCWNPGRCSVRAQHVE